MHGLRVLVFLVLGMLAAIALYWRQVGLLSRLLRGC